MRQVLALAAAAMIALAAPAGAGTPPAPAAAADPGALARKEVLDLALPASWRRYVDRFVTETGRVVDNGNGDISHSEGQGYALVLAAAFGDRATFDRVLAWTERELYAGGEFASWKWEPDVVPHVTDPNNATDGDILIAWGLVRGARAFEDPSLLELADRRIRSIRAKLVIDTVYGPALTPGAAGFSASDFEDGPVVNPSYWVFPALRDFAEVTPDLDWPAVSEAGYRLIEAARFGPLRLPTEWVALGGAAPAPAAAFPAEFSYNAVRIPLYLALDEGAPPALLDPFVGMWNPVDNIGPFVITVETGEAGTLLDGAGYRALFALADCKAGRRPADVIVPDDDLYYPATLGLFALLQISEDYSTCL